MTDTEQKCEDIVSDSQNILDLIKSLTTLSTTLTPNTNPDSITVETLFDILSNLNPKYNIIVPTSTSVPPSKDSNEANLDNTIIHMFKKIFKYISSKTQSDDKLSSTMFTFLDQQFDDISDFKDKLEQIFYEIISLYKSPKRQYRLKYLKLFPISLTFPPSAIGKSIVNSFIYEDKYNWLDNSSNGKWDSSNGIDYINYYTDETIFVKLKNGEEELITDSDTLKKKEIETWNNDINMISEDANAKLINYYNDEDVGEYFTLSINDKKLDLSPDQLDIETKKKLLSNYFNWSLDTQISPNPNSIYAYFSNLIKKLGAEELFKKISENSVVLEDTLLERPKLIDKNNNILNEGDKIEELFDDEQIYAGNIEQIDYITQKFTVKWDLYKSYKEGEEQINHTEENVFKFNEIGDLVKNISGGNRNISNNYQLYGGVRTYRCTICGAIGNKSRCPWNPTNWESGDGTLVLNSLKEQLNFQNDSSVRIEVHERFKNLAKDNVTYKKVTKNTLTNDDIMAIYNQVNWNDGSDTTEDYNQKLESYIYKDIYTHLFAGRYNISNTEHLKKLLDAIFKEKNADPKISTIPPGTDSHEDAPWDWSHTNLNITPTNIDNDVGYTNGDYKFKLFYDAKIDDLLEDRVLSGKPTIRLHIVLTDDNINRFFISCLIYCLINYDEKNQEYKPINFEKKKTIYKYIFTNINCKAPKCYSTTSGCKPCTYNINGPNKNECIIQSVVNIRNEIIKIKESSDKFNEDTHNDAVSKKLPFTYSSRKTRKNKKLDITWLHKTYKTYQFEMDETQDNYYLTVKDKEDPKLNFKIHLNKYLTSKITSPGTNTLNHQRTKITVLNANKVNICDYIVDNIINKGRNNSEIKIMLDYDGISCQPCDSDTPIECEENCPDSKSMKQSKKRIQTLRTNTQEQAKLRENQYKRIVKNLLNKKKTLRNTDLSKLKRKGKLDNTITDTLVSIVNYIAPPDYKSLLGNSLGKDESLLLTQFEKKLPAFIDENKRLSCSGNNIFSFLNNIRQLKYTSSPSYNPSRSAIGGLDISLNVQNSIKTKINEFKQILRKQQVTFDVYDKKKEEKTDDDFGETIETIQSEIKEKQKKDYSKLAIMAIAGAIITTASLFNPIRQSVIPALEEKPLGDDGVHQGEPSVWEGTAGDHVYVPSFTYDGLGKGKYGNPAKYWADKGFTAIPFVTTLIAGLAIKKLGGFNLDGLKLDQDQNYIRTKYLSIYQKFLEIDLTLEIYLVYINYIVYYLGSKLDDPIIYSIVSNTINKYKSYYNKIIGLISVNDTSLDSDNIIEDTLSELISASADKTSQKAITMLLNLFLNQDKMGVQFDNILNSLSREIFNIELLIKNSCQNVNISESNYLNCIRDTKKCTKNQKNCIDLLKDYGLDYVTNANKYYINNKKLLLEFISVGYNKEEINKVMGNNFSIDNVLNETQYYRFKPLSKILSIYIKLIEDNLHNIKDRNILMRELGIKYGIEGYKKIEQIENRLETNLNIRERDLENISNNVFDSIVNDLNNEIYFNGYIILLLLNMISSVQKDENKYQIIKILKNFSVHIPINKNFNLQSDKNFKILNNLNSIQIKARFMFTQKVNELLHISPNGIRINNKYYKKIPKYQNLDYLDTSNIKYDECGYYINLNKKKCIILIIGNLEYNIMPLCYEDDLTKNNKDELIQAEDSGANFKHIIETNSEETEYSSLKISKHAEMEEFKTAHPILRNLVICYLEENSIGADNPNPSPKCESITNNREQIKIKQKTLQSILKSSYHNFSELRIINIPFVEDIHENDTENINKNIRLLDKIVKITDDTKTNIEININNENQVTVDIGLGEYILTIEHLEPNLDPKNCFINRDYSDYTSLYDNLINPTNLLSLPYGFSIDDNRYKYHLLNNENNYEWDTDGKVVSDNNIADKITSSFSPNWYKHKKDVLPENLTEKNQYIDHQKEPPLDDARKMLAQALKQREILATDTPEWDENTIEINDLRELIEEKAPEKTIERPQNSTYGLSIETTEDGCSFIAKSPPPPYSELKLNDRLIKIEPTNSPEENITCEEDGGDVSTHDYVMKKIQSSKKLTFKDISPDWDATGGGGDKRIKLKKTGVIQFSQNWEKIWNYDSPAASTKNEPLLEHFKSAEGDASLDNNIKKELAIYTKKYIFNSKENLPNLNLLHYFKLKWDSVNSEYENIEIIEDAISDIKFLGYDLTKNNNKDSYNTTSEITLQKFLEQLRDFLNTEVEMTWNVTPYQGDPTSKTAKVKPLNYKYLYFGGALGSQMVTTKEIIKSIGDIGNTGESRIDMEREEAVTIGSMIFRIIDSRDKTSIIWRILNTNNNIIEKRNKYFTQALSPSQSRITNTKANKSRKLKTKAGCPEGDKLEMPTKHKNKFSWSVRGRRFLNWISGEKVARKRYSGKRINNVDKWYNDCDGLLSKKKKPKKKEKFVQRSRDLSEIDSDCYLQYYKILETPANYFNVIEDKKDGYLTYINLMNILYSTYKMGKQYFNININSPYILFEKFNYSNPETFKSDNCDNIFTKLYNYIIENRTAESKETQDNLNTVIREIEELWTAKQGELKTYKNSYWSEWRIRDRPEEVKNFITKFESYILHKKGGVFYNNFNKNVKCGTADCAKNQYCGHEGKLWNKKKICKDISFKIDTKKYNNSEQIIGILDDNRPTWRYLNKNDKYFNKQDTLYHTFIEQYDTKLGTFKDYMKGAAKGTLILGAVVGIGAVLSLFLVPALIVASALTLGPIVGEFSVGIIGQLTLLANDHKHPKLAAARYQLIRANYTRTMLKKLGGYIYDSWGGPTKQTLVVDEWYKDLEKLDTKFKQNLVEEIFYILFNFTSSQKNDIIYKCYANYNICKDLGYKNCAESFHQCVDLREEYCKLIKNDKLITRDPTQWDKRCSAYNNTQKTFWTDTDGTKKISRCPADAIKTCKKQLMYSNVFNTLESKHRKYLTKLEKKNRSFVQLQRSLNRISKTCKKIYSNCVDDLLDTNIEPIGITDLPDLIKTYELRLPIDKMWDKTESDLNKLWELEYSTTSKGFRVDNEEMPINGFLINNIISLSDNGRKIIEEEINRHIESLKSWWSTDRPIQDEQVMNILKKKNKVLLSSILDSGSHRGQHNVSILNRLSNDTLNIEIRKKFVNINSGNSKYELKSILMYPLQTNWKVTTKMGVTTGRSYNERTYGITFNHITHQLIVNDKSFYLFDIEVKDNSTASKYGVTSKDKILIYNNQFVVSGANNFSNLSDSIELKNIHNSIYWKVEKITNLGELEKKAVLMETKIEKTNLLNLIILRELELADSLKLDNAFPIKHVELKEKHIQNKVIDGKTVVLVNDRPALFIDHHRTVKLNKDKLDFINPSVPPNSATNAILYDVKFTTYDKFNEWRKNNENMIIPPRVESPRIFKPKRSVTEIDNDNNPVQQNATVKQETVPVHDADFEEMLVEEVGIHVPDTIKSLKLSEFRGNLSEPQKQTFTEFIHANISTNLYTTHGNDEEAQKPGIKPYKAIITKKNFEDLIRGDFFWQHGLNTSTGHYYGAEKIKTRTKVKSKYNFEQHPLVGGFKKSKNRFNRVKRHRTKNRQKKIILRTRYRGRKRVNRRKKSKLKYRKYV